MKYFYIYRKELPLKLANEADQIYIDFKTYINDDITLKQIAFEFLNKYKSIKDIENVDVEKIKEDIDEQNSDNSYCQLLAIVNEDTQNVLYRADKYLKEKYPLKDRFNRINEMFKKVKN